jgi:predicted component of viral defense system (DUF524 family)
MSFYKQVHDLLWDAFVTRSLGYTDILQKKDIWSDFAQQTHGEFQMKQTISKDLTSFYLNISDAAGTIEFTESDTHPLKVTCEFFTETPMSFSVFQKDIEDKIACIFKTKNLGFTHPEFDKKYIVKSSDEIAIRKILSQHNVIPIILKSNLFSISSHADDENKKQILTGIIGRYVNSVNEMQEIFSLFSVLGK